MIAQAVHGGPWYGLSLAGVVDCIFEFLREIGLKVSTAEIVRPTILPGIRIEAGGLVVDSARLVHPGDLLHEAGHLAVMPAARRILANNDTGADAGEEMAAIAWSYAAALHLELDPRVVFHDAGYRGGAQSLLENFADGRYVGVPMLVWRGLAVDKGVERFPRMLHWLAS